MRRQPAMKEIVCIDEDRVRKHVGMGIKYVRHETHEGR